MRVISKREKGTFEATIGKLIGKICAFVSSPENKLEPLSPSRNFILMALQKFLKRNLLLRSRFQSVKNNMLLLRTSGTVTFFIQKYDCIIGRGLGPDTFMFPVTFRQIKQKIPVHQFH